MEVCSESCADALGAIRTDDCPLSIQKQEWMEQQEVLKASLITHDSFSWTRSSSSAPEAKEIQLCAERARLQYVGGVDLSFLKGDPSVACGALVVLEFGSLRVVYEDFESVKLTSPYIPGFLAFRETPVLVGLLRRMACNMPALYPQVLMVDGNGILHPRGFGLASHLGVLVDIPTIGIGKNLLHVDGLVDKFKHMSPSENINAGHSVPLVGKSGKTWGAAFRSHNGCTKPIFVSVGHRISLETAITVVSRCCRHRVPEPVRQADIRSRERLRCMGEQGLG